MARTHHETVSMYEQTVLARLNDKKTEVKSRGNGVLDDQLSSHVIIETVEYKDYSPQENSHDEATQPNQNGEDETNYGEIIEFEEEYDEKWDCASLCECVYGIENTNEDGDDNFQWIEDNRELYRPSKMPKIDPTQVNNAQAEVIGEFPRQAVDDAQPNQMNNQDRHYTIVHLQCPQSGCSDTFAEGQLHQHMWAKHFIGPFRCFVKECGQSFVNTNILRQHIKEVHSEITEWPCDKCPKYFTAYQILSSHNRKKHQLGQFQCSFPSCTFKGESRRKVDDHYYQQHKRTLSCKHSGCNFRTSTPFSLKTHERIHSGFRPYKCKWAHCDFASAQRNNTIVHIRRNHFAPNQSSVPNGAQLDPSDYVEVVHQLL